MTIHDGQHQTVGRESRSHYVGRRDWPIPTQSPPRWLEETTGVRQKEWEKDEVLVPQPAILEQQPWPLEMIRLLHLA